MKCKYPIPAVFLFLPFLCFTQIPPGNDHPYFDGPEALIRLDEALKMVESFPDEVIQYNELGLERIKIVPLPKKYNRSWTFCFHLMIARASCVKGNFEKGEHHLIEASKLVAQFEDRPALKRADVLLDLNETRELLYQGHQCNKAFLAENVIKYCKVALAEVSLWETPQIWKNRWLFGIHLFLTKAYCVTGNFAEAQFHSQAALRIAEKIAGSSKKKEQEASKVLQNVELFLSVADSIGLLKDERQHQELAIQLRLLQQDNALREAELKATRRGVGFLSLLVFLVIVMAGAAFWILRTRQHAKELRYFASKDRELAMFREQLYVNITHELRTPLSLVISPLERLAETNPHPDIQTALLHARELLNSFNDILKWNKLEANAMTLTTQVGEVKRKVNKVVAKLKSMAKSKRITLEFTGNDEPVWGVMDFDKIETILSNLIINSIKFTEEGGSIKTETDLVGKSESQFLRLTVSDSGKGIPDQQLPIIFERYGQVGHNNTHIGGAGIGLALVKRLTELLGGQIEVLSETGKGTAFTVLLPFIKAEGFNDSDWQNDKVNQQGIIPINEEEDRSTVLLVEDNQELRAFIASGLSAHFNLLEAGTAEEGFLIAKENLPDLILTDLMLPGKMDGISMCKELKNDDLTSHIPILILTARSGLESRLEALDAKADAFLTKPFAAKELELTVQSLLDNRRRLRERFQTTLKLEWSADTNNSPDIDPYLKLVLNCINSHLDKPAFGVQRLAQAMKISRVQLFKKIKSLTGMPPGDLLRTIRLEKARRLLETGTDNVSEVAYQTGFVDPNYFSKAFKKHFGFPPSEVSREVTNTATG